MTKRSCATAALSAAQRCGSVAGMRDVASLMPSADPDADCGLAARLFGDQFLLGELADHRLRQRVADLDRCGISIFET